MNKELTPLEALDRLRPKTTYLPYYTRNEKRYYCDIIETALKDSEWYKQEMIKFEKAFTEENEEKLKLKQALEIIVKKDVSISLIKYAENYKDYCLYVKAWLPDYILTQEEFDLLKEALK